jgi:hypothetical protein
MPRPLKPSATNKTSLKVIYDANIQQTHQVEKSPLQRSKACNSASTEAVILLTKLEQQNG